MSRQCSAPLISECSRTDLEEGGGGGWRGEGEKWEGGWKEKGGRKRGEMGESRGLRRRVDWVHIELGT